MFQGPDGRTASFGHDDIVGRSDLGLGGDLRVSRQHAQVQRRPEGLCLIRLRGTLTNKGRVAIRVRLKPGVVIALSLDSSLTVLEVEDGPPVAFGDATQPPPLPLKITARFESVEIAGGALPEPLVLTGKGAAIVIELVRYGEPAPWFRIAKRVWPRRAKESSEDQRARVKKSWYTALKRLRDQLSTSGVRDNLVLSRGDGMILLTLLPLDEVRDESD